MIFKRSSSSLTDDPSKGFYNWKTLLQVGLLGGLCLFSSIVIVDGVMANPNPFRVPQPNSTITPLLYLQGDPRFHYLATSQGYTVVQDDKCQFVYAVRDNNSGYLMPTDMLVGEVDPGAMGLEPKIMPTMEARMAECELMCEEYNDDGEPGPSKPDAMKSSSSTYGTSNRLLASAGPAVKHNLVILVRFSNHHHRQLPPRSDYEILFNHQGPHQKVAQSGSIRDVFLANSYGQLDLQSTVHGWIDLPNSEEYYAAGKSGRTSVILEAIRAALQAVDNTGVPFSNFDSDNDNRVDVVTIIHSGYGAEVGGTDEDGQMQTNRIWSHKWGFPSNMHFISRDDTRVNKYSIGPGLWGTRDMAIGRIGTIAHEIGHVFGLPDLYGSSGGNGIGSYGMMGNSWGFDGTQLYPPCLSPWSKMQMGWLTPITISASTQVTLQSSALYNDVVKIDLNSDATEYLLIENRQQDLFDSMLPQGGLAIWHIDERAAHNTEGYPGQDDWPENGNHYQVALLQADGYYHLERRHNRGDGGDLFRAGGKDSLLPFSAGGTYPNTDSYQGGVVQQTGVSIQDISNSDDAMTFSVTIDGLPVTNRPTPNPTAPPTPAPTPSPTPYSAQELTTHFRGGNGAAGAMFDVKAHKDIELFGLKIHIYTTAPAVTVEVWMKTDHGSFRGFQVDAGAWTQVTQQQVQGMGFGQGSPVQFDPIPIAADQTLGLYVTLPNTSLGYTNGVGINTVLASNSDVDILGGVGKQHRFGRTYSKREWNGAIMYNLASNTQPVATPPPTSKPTLEPTESPSASPTDMMMMPLQLDKTLHTTFAGGAEEAGNMFDVLAFQDVLVTGFDIHTSFTTTATVAIFSRMDSYKNHENECNDWEIVTAVQVQGLGNGMPTPLPPSSFDPILIPAFRVRAFYITIATGIPRGMRYTPGTPGSGAGSLVTADGAIAIFEGVGKEYPCAVTYPNRIWNGVIHYKPREEVNPPTPSPPPPPPASTNQPTLPNVSTLTTTFIGGRQSAGIMFDVEAVRSISLVGMSLHIASKGQLNAEMYIASTASYKESETTRSSWTKIMSESVQGQGRGNPSLVPPGSFDPIAIPAGESIALYVTLTTNYMRYSVGSTFVNAGENGDLIVTKGTGRSYPFGKAYRDRVFNGILEYIVTE